MKDLLSRVLKNSITEADNQTFDLGRLIWGIGAIVFFILSIISTVHGTAFSPTDWGIGFGSVMAGGGVAIAIKSRET